MDYKKKEVLNAEPKKEIIKTVEIKKVPPHSLTR